VSCIDFQKAVDKASNKRKMLKVKGLGIASVVFDRIQDWLHDRELRVVMLGVSSNWIEVKSGFHREVCWHRYCFLFVLMMLMKVWFTEY
jgi:hypothetical protein